MSHLINTEIFENLLENYQIYKCTIHDGIVGVSRYVIKDDNDELIRYDHKLSWSSKIDAEKALYEIISQKFEELSK